MSEDNHALTPMGETVEVALEDQQQGHGLQDVVVKANVQNQKEKSVSIPIQEEEEEEKQEEEVSMDDREEVEALRPMTEAMYRAILVAGDIVGEAAVQFPGRDKLLQIMKNVDMSCNQPKGTTFGAWRLAIEHLKKVGLVHSIPNSGTFVSHSKVRNIGNLLEMLRKVLSLREESNQGRGAAAYASIGNQKEEEQHDHFSSESLSTVIEEEEGTDHEEDTILTSSEDELAAEILKDLKFSEPIKASSSSRRKKKKGGPASNTNSGSRHAPKARGGRRSASNGSGGNGGAVAYTLPSDFELKGPWQPKDEGEKEAYLLFLDRLLEENKNVTHWTKARLQKSVAAIFGVLHVAPRGLPRIELRNAARAFVGDTGLLDYTIKVLVNRVLCGFYMKRDTDPSTGKLLYYAEFVDPETKQQLEKQLRKQASYSQQVNQQKVQPRRRRERKPTFTKNNTNQAATAGREMDESDSQNKPSDPGSMRSNGKRKVNSPKRFADYSHDYTKPAKKRHTAAAQEDIANDLPLPKKNVHEDTPLPPKLQPSYVHMQQRVNVEQGNMIASPDVSCKKEVQGFVNGMIKHFQEQSHNIVQAPSLASYQEMQNNWVNQRLQGQIMVELSGMYQAIQKVGEQLKEVDPLA